MLVNENFRIKASIDSVWQFMVDPEKVGSCIPGFERVEVLGDNRYKTFIRIKLPIFSIMAEATTTVTEFDPPQHLKSITEGRYDLGDGKFRQEMVVDLKAKADHEVEVSYQAETVLEGGLGGFGEKMMGDMAKGFAEQFAQNIRSKLEEEKPG
jgi:carbon monoxide dehydrogenase subunit G